MNHLILRLDIFTFVSVIQACANLGVLEQGKELNVTLEEMSTKGEN